MGDLRVCEPPKQRDDSGCTQTLVVAGLAVAVYLGWKAWHFFERPGAIHELVETLTAIGICAGIGLLALVALMAAARYSSWRSDQITRLSRDYGVRCSAFELPTMAPAAVLAAPPGAPGIEIVSRSASSCRSPVMASAWRPSRKGVRGTGSRQIVPAASAD